MTSYTSRSTNFGRSSARASGKRCSAGCVSISGRSKTDGCGPRKDLQGACQRMKSLSVGCARAKLEVAAQIKVSRSAA